MTKIKILLGLVIVLLASCNSDGGYKKLSNGLQYKIISGNSKDSLLKKNDIIMTGMTIKFLDSLGYNSYESGHRPVLVDTTLMPLTDEAAYMSVLKYMRKGDSAVIRVPSDSIYKEVMKYEKQANPKFNEVEWKSNLPKFITQKGGYVTFGLKVLDHYGNRVDTLNPNYAKDTARLNADMAIQKDKRQRFMVIQQAKEKKKSDDLVAKNKKEGEKFFAENKSKKDVITTPSGLQYQVIKLGTGAKPTANDNVLVNYEGKLLNGVKFDGNDSVKFNVSGVVPGWTEVLQLMPVGSKYKVWVPSALGYGEQGGGKIEPASTLVFDMELLQIAPPMPSQGGAAGAGQHSANDGHNH
jgi:FKBP-type peptidyl-prolyl cis-trans isomerase